MNSCLFTPKMTGNRRHIMLLLFLAVSTGTTLFAQEPAADTSGSHALIEKGIKLHDAEKYTEALACFSQVSKCDPNYRWALFESALTLNTTNDLTGTLKKCDEAISLHYDIPQLYALKGTILDQSGKPREGADVIGSALKNWPYNQGLLFNLAVCLANLHQYEQAEKVLLKSIRINPYHPGSHLALAKMNLFMGRTGQAYLAFNMAVLLNPQVSVLTQYENAIFGKYDSLIHAWKYSYSPVTDSVKWKNLALILQTGLPYRDDFEFPGKPDYKVMRMAFFLMENIAYDKADTSLYNQFYVRFFTEMMNEQGFEVFLNYCLRNIENTTVKEWLSKNQDEYEKFVKWAQRRISNGRYYAFSRVDEIAGIARQHYNDNGRLEAIGPMLVKDMSKQGEWITLDEYGCVMDYGNYENGKKNGGWTVFWPNAAVKQRLVYHEDLLNGTCTTYGENGAKSGTYHFTEGKQNDREERFNSSGSLNSFVTYVADTAQGPAMKTIYDAWYKRELSNSHGKATGMITETWLNGAKKFTGNFKDDLRNGPHLYWYPNDSLESKETYVNDTLTGTFQNYFKNGRLSREGGYNEKGLMQGIFRNYSRNGNLLQVDSTYTDGLLTGTETEFYSSGKKREVTWIDKGVRVRMKSYDSTGKMICQAELKDGLLHYKGFYPDSRIMLEGDYVNNKQHGVWTTFSPSGKKISQATYVDGQVTGMQTKYHKSGRVKEQYTTDSSRIVGEYVEYHPGGNVKTKGNYRLSGAYGDWYSYFPDDSLESRSFLLDGHLAGCLVNRTLSHKTDTEIYYEDEGKEIRTCFFDRNGDMVYDWDYHYGESKGVNRYPGGEIYRVFTMCDNLRNGVAEIYFPNGKLGQQMTYCFGKVDGLMKTWSPDGNLLFEASFSMGEWNGLRKDYTDGKLTSIIPMEDNNMEGIGIDYDENGKISRMIEMSGNIREGNSDYFAPDGKLIYRVVYWNDFVAGYTGCGPDGKLLPVIPVTAETTEMSTTYPDGKPAMKAGLKNGVYHGKFTSWYPDGNVMREAFYDKDEAEAVFRTWYPAKVLKESVTYKNGYRNGLFQLFHPSGGIRHRGAYYYDEENGEWEVFDEQGKHMATYLYDCGKLYEIRTF